MKKWLVGVVLALICALGLPTLAFADSTVYTEGTLYYTVGNGTITITGSFGRDAEVTVPNQVAGIPVNTIAAGAFANNSHVTKVNLPDTVTSVEDGAFAASQTVVFNYNTDHSEAVSGGEASGTSGGGASSGGSSGGSSASGAASGSAGGTGTVVEGVVVKNADGTAAAGAVGMSESEVTLDEADVNVADGKGSESTGFFGMLGGEQGGSNRSSFPVVPVVVVLIVAAAGAAGVFVWRKKAAPKGSSAK